MPEQGVGLCLRPEVPRRGFGGAVLGQVSGPVWDPVENRVKGLWPTLVPKPSRGLGAHGWGGCLGSIIGRSCVMCVWGGGAGW